MDDNRVLSEAEWEVITELLEEQSRDLPREIRHTCSRTYREQLQRRLKIIDALLERLHQPAHLG